MVTLFFAFSFFPEVSEQTQTPKQIAANRSTHKLTYHVHRGLRKFLSCLFFFVLSRFFIIQIFFLKGVESIIVITVVELREMKLKTKFLSIPFQE